MFVGGTSTEATRIAAPVLRDATSGTTTSTLTSTQGGTSAGPATVVDLSRAAKTAATTTPAATKSFATVAKDARSTIDAVYAKGAKPFSIYTTASEAKNMFADLDRRSLYAIKSNEGGQFTEQEQAHAGMEMRVRMDAATGQDRMANVTDNRAINDMWKRTVNFLDGVSDEEKGSYDWAFTRARAQWSYEMNSKATGDVPEKMDSTNPIVKMLKTAMDSLVAMNDPSKQLEDMPQYKQAQAMFASQGTGVKALDVAV